MDGVEGKQKESTEEEVLETENQESQNAEKNTKRKKGKKGKRKDSILATEEPQTETLKPVSQMVETAQGNEPNSINHVMSQPNNTSPPESGIANKEATIAESVDLESRQDSPSLIQADNNPSQADQGATDSTTPVNEAQILVETKKPETDIGQNDAGQPKQQQQTLDAIVPDQVERQAEVPHESEVSNPITPTKPRHETEPISGSKEELLQSSPDMANNSGTTQVNKLDVTQAHNPLPQDGITTQQPNSGTQTVNIVQVLPPDSEKPGLSPFKISSSASLPDTEPQLSGPQQTITGNTQAQVEAPGNPGGPAPSPKKSKNSSELREQYQKVKSIWERGPAKITKAENLKKSKLAALQEVLSAKEDLAKRVGTETRTREVDKSAKEALLHQLESEIAEIMRKHGSEQRNDGIPVLKKNRFEEQVNFRKEELKKKNEELKVAAKEFAERAKLQAEIGAVQKEVLRLTRANEKHVGQINSLQQKEKDSLDRLRSSGLNYEQEKAKLESLIQQSLLEAEKLAQDDAAILQKIEQAVLTSKNLEKEIEFLRLQEFEYKEKFELDNKFSRDECVRLRKELTAKDEQQRRLQQENLELTEKCRQLDEEIGKTVTSIKEILAASKSQVASNPNAQRFQRAQKEALEKLLNEKNELKGEVDRLSREKGKLTVIVKDLGEVSSVREANLTLLIEFLAVLDNTDRMSVEKELMTNLNPKTLDVKKLVKRTVARNIDLKYELERLEKECRDSGVDLAES